MVRYRALDVDMLIERIALLRVRIHERFPERHLVRVCDALAEVSREIPARLAMISHPILWLRVLVVATIVVLASGAVIATDAIVNEPVEALAATDFVQVIDAVFNEVVLIGAALVFLVRIERRVKQRRTLAALHELRALAHVIDVHQLAKDPDRILHRHTPTEHSPVEEMTPDELVRYLNYCSEMLALIGKLAALHVQHFDDDVAIAGVNEVEELCLGLSRKIWQKIMIVHQEAPRAPAPAPTPA